MRTFSERPARCLYATLLVGMLSFQASAHEGPPYPILLDQPAGPYVVSVWADPDIGDATFFVIFETPDGEIPDHPPREVSLSVEPTDGRLQPVTYPAQKQSLRNALQFESKPYFDKQDFWKVGFHIVDSEGNAFQLQTEVESTPPGYGAWDLLVYLFPFVLLGGAWVLGMIRHLRRRQQVAIDNEGPFKERAP